MTTVANQLTIGDLPNWQTRLPAACRNLAWPMYLRFLAMAGAAAVNLSVGPVWLGEFNHSEPVGGPPSGTSLQGTAGLTGKAGRPLQPSTLN